MTDSKRPGDLIQAIANRVTAKLRDPGVADPQDAHPVALAQLHFLPAMPFGIPNAILRSALFGAIKRGRRRYLERERLAAVEGVTLTYTGPRLDQSDFSLWQVLVETLRGEPIGAVVHLTAYEILKRLGNTDTGENRRSLEKRLSRLGATGVEIGAGPVSYEGSLIVDLHRNKVTREYVIQLNPAMRRLFEGSQWTAVDWAVRQELEGHPLAQWLHGFYSTHAKPYPMSWRRLHELCGSEATGPKAESDWKTKDLPRALGLVHDACEKHGQRFDWEMDGALVTVARSPSRSQRRNLLKGAARRRPSEPDA